VFAFAWMFSGWGSFSSRKLLTEKVIIAKLKNVFPRQNTKLWNRFLLLNVYRQEDFEYHLADHADPARDKRDQTSRSITMSWDICLDTLVSVHRSRVAARAGNREI
jgi:hypothetical protein